MVKSISLAVVAVVGLMAATPAEAARADRRQANQQARIVQGVNSGELTKREAVRLEAQHVALQREIRQDRADDGHLDAAERAKIERQQDRLNRRISVQKHDAQSR
ncbi:hypothetical protein [Hyalangium versicolor]|uniref:hypothetical protein n=1 Tax=Hyalangium versicolor TaxID=2861190 RepID=UPI001CC95D66|nr:hypothetical protein [Hyalangium versicolor]